MERDFKIQHVEGAENPADAASRQPQPSRADTAGAQMHLESEPSSGPVPRVRGTNGLQLPYLASQEELDSKFELQAVAHRAAVRVSS